MDAVNILPTPKTSSYAPKINDSSAMDESSMMAESSIINKTDEISLTDLKIQPLENSNTLETSKNEINEANNATSTNSDDMSLEETDSD